MGCYGSTCHSRQEATGVVVRQNEILTWQDTTSVSGAHLRAYTILLDDRAKDIARRLGIGPAHEAKECLACHSNDIAPERRGPKFQVSDGISCEACHGGSTEWLTQHYGTGNSHSQNVANGMYALENPKVRAGVCLSCHLGSDAPYQFVDHRMMAAGHPRMTFELDLFTSLQSHHDEDFDYARRKGISAGTYVWGIGQIMTVKQQFRLFLDQDIAQKGLFPELVFFDCLACHRPISEDPDWRPNARINPGRPADPGQVKFNDAHLIMLIALARQISPELETELSRQKNQLHAAISFQSNLTIKTIENINTTLDMLAAELETQSFSKAETLNIAEKIVEDTLAERYTDYVAAEQAVMAVDTLLSSMIARRQLSPFDVADMRDDIEAAYDAVEVPLEYDQEKMVTALQRIRLGFRTLR